MAKAKRNGDFNKREREIREALFSVFYEKDWHLTFKRPAADEDPEGERWKFVDFVIDKLREQQSKKGSN